MLLGFGIGVFTLIVTLAIILRSGWKPSWNTTATLTSTPPSGGKTAKGFADTVFGILGVCVAIFLIYFMGVWCYRIYRWSKSPTTTYVVQQVPQHTEPVVVNQCITPCSMPVGWGPQRVAWPEGYALNIKYNGFNHFVEFEDMEGKNLKLADRKELSVKFQPGDAEFTSPIDEHILVQVYNK